MPIFYAVVARGNVPLAEYSSRTQGNAGTIARKILDTIPASQNLKKTYVIENYFFHYEVADGLVYMCLTDEAFGRTLPFVFLDDVKKRFMSEFGNRWKTLISSGAQTDFGRVLKQLTDYYSSDVNADRIRKVQGALTDVREVMMENIEKVLARGEKIEETMLKTNEMANNAVQFKKTSISLKTAMWWKNFRIIIIIVVVLILIGYIIAAIVCKSPIFKGCWSKNQSPEKPVSAAANLDPTLSIVLGAVATAASMLTLL